MAHCLLAAPYAASVIRFSLVKQGLKGIGPSDRIHAHPLGMRHN